MGTVIQMRRRSSGAKRSETMELLTELMELEKRGELDGFMPFIDCHGETKYKILGSFAGRLQFAGYTLIKTIACISDKIAESGTAGNTSVSSMGDVLLKAPSTLPKRLREVTAYGDLK